MNLENFSVKAEDIGRLDENTKSLGIPTMLLMECAGLQATNEIIKHYGLNDNSEVLIFCGKGNNGGDGFVVARHLATRGIKVLLVLLSSPDEIRTKDAQMNWNILQNLPLNIQCNAINDSTLLTPIFQNIDTSESFTKRYDIIVDALLGTGIQGKIREPYATAIHLINSSKIPIVSLDVPSGMDPNSGEISDISVKANFRVTFHREKIGLAKKHSSKDVYVAPIGTPLEAHLFVGDGDLRECLKTRKKNTHKGQFGKLCIIGGSHTYSGAPALAALACQKLGLDLIQLLVPKSIVNSIRCFSPNLIVNSGYDINLCSEDVDQAKKLCDWADAILIGPGMGTSEETYEFFNQIFPWMLSIKKPIVVDADAIKFTKKVANSNKSMPLPPYIVFTPHIGELSTLIEIKDLPSNSNVLEIGSSLVEKLSSIGGTFLCKGVNDYIVQIGRKPLQWRVNKTGCPEMSVGGTGDVLAGITAGLLCLGNETFLSACSAAFLNGLLGIYCKDLMGPRIQATDLIEKIREFLQNRGY